MLRCEHCGAYIPEKGVFCPRCGEKVTPPEGKRKTAAGKWFRRMLGKFFALLLYLILSAVHMVVIFVCVYGGIILATLSGITFIAGILTIILMYMQPEFGYNWECVIPCFVFSFAEAGMTLSVNTMDVAEEGIKTLNSGPLFNVNVFDFA